MPVWLIVLQMAISALPVVETAVADIIKAIEAQNPPKPTPAQIAQIKSLLAAHNHLSIAAVGLCEAQGQ